MGERRKRSRTFGTTRKLPSGRWQIRYYDQAGNRHTSPVTFPSKADALAHLSTIEADMLRRQWTDPPPEHDTARTHSRRFGLSPIS